ncbi:sigma factor, ECF subfamily protein, partial [bacterium]|nr:sigma factor, ECF subfamily protein [bacterium]
MNDVAAHNKLPPSVHDTVNHLFRHESGKMVSLLTRIFGFHNLQLAEDVVQETLLKALTIWPFSGIPHNPSGWLFQTAKNLALDKIRRERFTVHYADDLSLLLKSEWSVVSTLNDLFLGNEIQDDQLRMMFTCCHPAFPIESQVALTLKTLCGFSIGEIAKAFLTNEPAINKRLYRAKQEIRSKKVRFEIPIGVEIHQRITGVLSVLYLMFNEGYASSNAERLIREDLVAEAMRLARLLAEHPECRRPEVCALLALMSFHASRFVSRIDDHGHILLLEEQDRTLWDEELIRQGHYYLEESAHGDYLTSYHVEAAIAYYYVEAKTFEETRWDEILKLYDQLQTLSPSPVIALNRAVVIAQLHGPQQGLEAIGQISGVELLANYYILYATLGDLHRRMQAYEKAEINLQKAMALTDSPIEKDLLMKKLHTV